MLIIGGAFCRDEDFVEMQAWRLHDLPITGVMRFEHHSMDTCTGLLGMQHVHELASDDRGADCNDVACLHHDCLHCPDFAG